MIVFLLDFILKLLGKKEEPMSRKTNQAGIDLIKKSEGCRLTAYPDPGTGGAPWTCGYGHTGADVTPGLTVTQEQADAWLVQDLAKFEQGVENSVQVNLTDNQFAALVVFSYNVGLGHFRSSTLLIKLNAGDYSGAAEQFLVWNKAAGKVLPGLTTRRENERALFLS